MKYFSLPIVAGTVAAVFISGSAMADHNSVHGAGWANMPNDIHNARIEDNLSNDEWRDFVSKGAGADTVNRYLDTDTVTSRGMSDRAQVQRGGGGRR